MPIQVERLQQAVLATHDAYLADLEALVNIDCGSYTPDGVNRVAALVARRLSEAGADVTRVHHTPQAGERQLGDLVIGRLDGAGPRLLLIGHMDTVFEVGTVAARPYRADRERATGPGVTDMKAGLLAGLAALRALRECGARRSVTFVANPDEEIGSPFSTSHIRALVPDHDVALVLECARANGDLVSARKGVADAEVVVTGRAAHAGIEPEKGRHAILAAARQVERVQALNGRWPGVTANVGVIQGGTRPNVVPAACRYEVDLRATSGEGFDAAWDELAAIVAAPDPSGSTSELRRTAHHPPMERTPATGRLVALAVTIAAELGFHVADAATGGASDANTTSAAGLPTLDGLGPVGGDDHSAEEWLDLASVAPRTTLLASLIDRVGEAL